MHFSITILDLSKNCRESKQRSRFLFKKFSNLIKLLGKSWKFLTINPKISGKVGT